MSVIAIPYGETLDSNSSSESIKKTRTLASYKFHGRMSPLRDQWTRNRRENSPTKSLSPASCDPLLDFINLDDFEDDAKLQRNFENVLKIHKLGFPVKIIKQNWFPGLVCIPIFHCQRCLALWTQAAQVPSFCSEVNRSVYGRLIPISITKCNLLTKLLDRKPTAKRLCKQFSVSKPEVKPERSTDNSFGGKMFRPIPMAEFVDINEQLQKYRRKFMRGLKGNGTEASGRFLETIGPASSPVDDYGSEGKEGMAYGGQGRLGEVDSNYGTAVGSEETSAADEDVKFKFNPKYYNQRLHDTSCNVKRNGYPAGTVKPSKSRQANRLENGLTITSKNKASSSKLIDVGTKPTKLTPRQITKTKRPAPRTCRQATNHEVPLDVGYENRLAELRQKTHEFDKRALRVVFGDKLETVFGDKVETLDASMVNSVWFKNLVEDFGKKEEKLRTYKRDLTRAFCFSYFDLLRKIDFKKNVH